MATITSTDYADNRPVISTMKLTPNGMTYEVGDALARSSISSILERIEKLEQKKIEFTELSCRNCGATLKQGYLDPIVKCPYCKTVYAIGIKQVNSV